MELARSWMPVLFGMLTVVLPAIGLVAVAFYRLSQVEAQLKDARDAANKRLAELQEQIEDLKDQLDEKLFQQGGELRYVTVRACDEEQNACRDRMTIILNSIHENMKAIREDLNHIKRGEIMHPLGRD